MFTLSPEQIENFPVPHLSFSALRSYLTDRQAFFRRYVRWEFDNEWSPALFEGNTCHRILEEYYKAALECDSSGKKMKGFDWNGTIKKIIAEEMASDAFRRIEWGKTGSIDKSIMLIEQSMEFYQKDLPIVQGIVAVEGTYVSDFETPDGELMPIPLKGKLDLIHTVDGELVARDHKFISTFTDIEALREDGLDGDPVLDLQAAQYFFNTYKTLGRYLRRMVFDQVKKSKNKDGSPQRKEYVVDFVERPEVLARFLELYRRVVRELSGQPPIDPETGVIYFVPNPFAMYGWKDAWLDFCEEVETGKQWNLHELKELRENKFSASKEEAAAILEDLGL